MLAISGDAISSDPPDLATLADAKDTFVERYVEPVGLLDDGTEVFIPFPVLDDSDDDDVHLEKGVDAEVVADKARKLAEAEAIAVERHVEPVGLLDDGTEVFIPFPVLDDSDEDDVHLEQHVDVDVIADKDAKLRDAEAIVVERHVEPVGLLDDGTEVFIPFPVLDDSDEDDVHLEKHVDVEVIADKDDAHLEKHVDAEAVADKDAIHDMHPVEWSSEEDTCHADVKEFREMEEHGYAILKKALTSEQVQHMRELLAAELQVAIDKETLPPGDPAGSFAKIHNRECRHDLRLKLEDHVRSALEHCVNAHNNVYKKLLPPNAPLVELGVITSHPGAQSQIIHADVDFCETARKIFTTFVALQAVDESMGPTEIWPGTHTAYFCDFYKPKMLGPVDPYYQENRPERMTIEAGDAVLLDTRVMHRGGGNCSQSDRMLFHFSWETTAEEDPPQGFTYNLRPELHGKHHLSEFLQEAHA